ncbi:aspartate/glutamate racemase family protein [Williamsia soli]|uniref:aspartate/glutamate racemase family protein n=1 Tax=Williamsia soli TaxID=364929 RepID=UPI001A9E6F1F|nr:aspartate/glutamate racemase family protein [Williamsia soli]
MRTLGLIGGMSWVSTAEYYRYLNEDIARRLGGLHSARILLESVDFDDIERHKLRGDWATVGAKLSAAAQRLQTAGADAIVLCTNTMHHVAPAIENAIAVPFLHIGDTTARAILAEGITHVGLLATSFTMEQPFLRDRIAAHGVKLVVPDADDRAEIDRIIYTELCRGLIVPHSRQTMRAIVDRLLAAGSHGIVLGCTEIELLLDPADFDIPTFPSAQLHATAAVDFALTSDHTMKRPHP